MRIFLAMSSKKSKRLPGESLMEKDFIEDTLLPKLKSFFTSSPFSKNQENNAKIINIFSYFSFYKTINGADESSLHNNGDYANGSTVSLPSLKLESCDQLIEEDQQHENFIKMIRTEKEFEDFTRHLKIFIQEFVEVNLKVFDQIQAIDEFLKVLYETLT